MTDIKKIVFISLFFALSAFIAQSITQYHQQRSAANKPKLSQPDSFVENIKILQMNKDGQLHYSMTSPKIIHYTHDDSIDLSEPHFIIYSDNGKQPWYISSLTGKTSQALTQIILQQQVTLTQPAGTKNLPTTINTEELIVFPKQDMALTAKFIKFTQPGIIVTAIGAKAYLHDKHIQLLSHTRGIYDPSQAQAIHTPTGS